MAKLSTKRLEEAERFSREQQQRRAEQAAAEARTMTLAALNDEDLAALGLLAGKYDQSVSELCASIVKGWLNAE